MTTTEIILLVVGLLLLRVAYLLLRQAFRLLDRLFTLLMCRIFGRERIERLILKLKAKKASRYPYQQQLFDEDFPMVNIDGTPMIDEFIDANGNLFGFTDHDLGHHGFNK